MYNTTLLKILPAGGKLAKLNFTTYNQIETTVIIPVFKAYGLFSFDRYLCNYVIFIEANEKGIIPVYGNAERIIFSSFLNPLISGAIQCPSFFS
jgi:hypothetical protein